MAFQSKQQVLTKHLLLEQEMLKYAYNLLYETNLDVDQVKHLFVEQFGEESIDFLEEILDAQ